MQSPFAPSPDTTTTVEHALARRVRRSIRVIAALSVVLVAMTTTIELFSTTGANSAQRTSRLLMLVIVVSAAIVANRASNRVALGVGVTFTLVGVAHALYSI